jgi:hypothetical protein
LDPPHFPFREFKAKAIIGTVEEKPSSLDIRRFLLDLEKTASNSPSSLDIRRLLLDLEKTVENTA